MDYLQITFIVLTGLMAGVMSGFAGVGGAFIVTPALIILGIPAHLAVGSSIFWVAINSLAGTLLHKKMGNVDIKLGLVMAPTVMGGVEIGVRILNGAKRMGIADEAVLLITVCLLSIVGFGTLLEAMKRKHGLDLSLQQDGEATSVTEKPALSLFVQKIQLPPYLYLPTSGVRISLWVALIIGVCVGTLAGFIGVGGGFIMMPAFIYIMGIPTLTALGTDLFQIIISATYGTVRHYSSGNTVMSLVVLLLFGSLIGGSVWDTGHPLCKRCHYQVCSGDCHLFRRYRSIVKTYRHYGWRKGVVTGEDFSRCDLWWHGSCINLHYGACLFRGETG